MDIDKLGSLARAQKEISWTIQHPNNFSASIGKPVSITLPIEEWRALNELLEQVDVGFRFKP